MYKSINEPSPSTVVRVPSTKSYLEAREKLIAEDRSLRHDCALLQKASEDELRAEELVKNIKAAEDKSIWSIEHEGVTNTFAGMEFLSGL